MSEKRLINPFVSNSTNATSKSETPLTGQFAKKEDDFIPFVNSTPATTNTPNHHNSSMRGSYQRNNKFQHRGKKSMLSSSNFSHQSPNGRYNSSATYYGSNIKNSNNSFYSGSNTSGGGFSSQSSFHSQHLTPSPRLSGCGGGYRNHYNNSNMMMNNSPAMTSYSSGGFGSFTSTPRSFRSYSNNQSQRGGSNNNTPFRRFDRPQFGGGDELSKRNPYCSMQMFKNPWAHLTDEPAEWEDWDSLLSENVSSPIESSENSNTPSDSLIVNFDEQSLNDKNST